MQKLAWYSEWPLKIMMQIYLPCTFKIAVIGWKVGRRSKSSTISVRLYCNTTGKKLDGLGLPKSWLKARNWFGDKKSNDLNPLFTELMKGKVVTLFRFVTWVVMWAVTSDCRIKCSNSDYRRGFVSSLPCHSHSALCNVYPVALVRTRR